MDGKNGYHNESAATGPLCSIRRRIRVLYSPHSSRQAPCEPRCRSGRDHPGNREKWHESCCRIKNRESLFAHRHRNHKREDSVSSYTIQRGDTIDRVTKTLGMTWDEFRQTNPDAVGRSAKTGKWIIKAGAEVKGPGSFQSVLQEQQSAAKDAARAGESPKAEDKRTEYTVKQGDTLWRLADTFGVSIKEIARIEQHCRSRSDLSWTEDSRQGTGRC